MHKTLILQFIVSFFTIAIIQAADDYRLKAELPLFGNFGFINLPGAMNPPISKAESGLGYDMGVGLYFRAHEKFNLRFGVHHWGMQLNTNINARSGSKIVLVEENGVIRYNGIYVLYVREWDEFFLQGGLDISFYNYYVSDRVLFENGAKTAEAKDSHSSILTDEFNSLFHVYVGGGYKIPLNQKLDVIINLNWAPMSSAIYNSGQKGISPVMNNGELTGDFSSSDVNLAYLSTFKFGLIFQFGVLN